MDGEIHHFLIRYIMVTCILYINSDLFHTVKTFLILVSDNLLELCVVTLHFIARKDPLCKKLQVGDKPFVKNGFFIHLVRKTLLNNL